LRLRHGRRVLWVGEPDDFARMGRTSTIAAAWAAIEIETLQLIIEMPREKTNPGSY